VLNAMSFASGYQVIFAIGFAGSMLSVYHLFQVKPVGSVKAISQSNEFTSTPAAGARLEILHGPFRKLLIMMFLLNIAVFMLSPIFPLYQVNVLHLSDQTISLAAALFGLVQFIVSTQSGRISRRLGFRKMTGIGMTIASFSTLMFTFSFNPWLYYSTQLVGGSAWSIFGGGAVNYLLENVPAYDSSAHLAWFNLTINAAVLLCGLLSSSLVSGLGLFGAMILGVLVRFLVGLAVIKIE
jgi:MFS family permease